MLNRVAAAGQDWAWQSDQNQTLIPISLHVVAHPLSNFLDIIGTLGWYSLYPKLPFLSGCSLAVLPGTGLGLPRTFDSWGVWAWVRLRATSWSGCEVRSPELPTAGCGTVTSHGLLCGAGEEGRTALPLRPLGRLPLAPVNSGSRDGGSSAAGADRSHQHHQASPPCALSFCYPILGPQASPVLKASPTSSALPFPCLPALAPQEKDVDVIKVDQDSGAPRWLRQ